MRITRMEITTEPGPQDTESGGRFVYANLQCTFPLLAVIQRSLNRLLTTHIT